MILIQSNVKQIVFNDISSTKNLRHLLLLLLVNIEISIV